MSSFNIAFLFMFVVCFVFYIRVLASSYKPFNMPESVANLKRENNALKAQLSTMADEIAKLKETIEQHSNGAVSPASEDGARSVEFLTTLIALEPRPKRIFNA